MWSAAPDGSVFSTGAVVVVGSNVYVRPKDNITRAETAVIVKRLLEKAGLI